MTRRVLAAMLGFTLVLLAGVVVPLGLVTAQRDRQVFADRALAAAGAAAASAEEQLTDHLHAASRPGVLAYRPPPVGADRVGIYDISGRPLSRAAAALATPAEVTSALHGRTAVRWRSRPGDTLLVVVPVHEDTRVVGALALARPTGALEGQLGSLWAGLALTAALAAALAAALSFALSRWAGLPLRRLGHVTSQFGSGALDARAPVGKGPPEVRRLAAAFNSMAAQLQGLIGGHRAFLADVSHQLRTPLAALRLRLELLEQDTAPSTAGELRQALEEIRRLSRLVDGLLAAARAEHATAAPVPVRVRDILADRAAAWQPLAAERGIRLAVPDAVGTFTAAATPGHLEQVLDNLIANALDVVPAGGTIRLTATAGAHAVRITVADSGPGMDDARKQRAFRRFWTEPAAAGEHGDRDGTGLGLAIVHRLITADHGSIDLADSDLGGLAAIIDLPRPGSHGA
ncbi:MAG TPA: HAMP domain-containing sensor histidine kinase [Streptosporangiaceae bacterium]|nr:HAMP domain-containing sensor histidine kinase [Streptosporangiaceae bacterium]